MAIKLVAADPHPLSLLGLAQLLKSEPGFELLASCTTAAETLKAVWKEQPDILLVDINLPDRNGLELINELKNSSLVVIVVSWQLPWMKIRRLTPFVMGSKVWS